MENHVGIPASRPNDPHRRQSEPNSASSTKSSSSSKIQARPKQDDGKLTYGLGPILERFIPNQYHKLRSVKTPHHLQPTSRPSRPGLGSPFEYKPPPGRQSNGGSGSLAYGQGTAGTAGPSGYTFSSQNPSTTAWTDQPPREPAHSSPDSKTSSTNPESPSQKEPENYPILVHTHMTTPFFHTHISRSGVIFIDPYDLPSFTSLETKIRLLISSGRFTLDQRWSGVGRDCKIFVAVRWNVDFRAEVQVPDAVLGTDEEVADALRLVVSRGGRDNLVVRCLVRAEGERVGGDGDADETEDEDGEEGGMKWGGRRGRGEKEGMKSNEGRGEGDRLERDERMGRRYEEEVERDEGDEILWMKRSTKSVHWPGRQSLEDVFDSKTPEKQSGGSKIPVWSGSPRISGMPEAEIGGLRGTLKATNNHPSLPSPLKLSFSAENIESDEHAGNVPRWPFGIKGRSIDATGENAGARGYEATKRMQDKGWAAMRSPTGSVLMKLDPNNGNMRFGSPSPRNWRPPGAVSVKSAGNQCSRLRG